MAIYTNIESSITDTGNRNTVQFSIQPDAHLFKTLTKSVYNNVILAPIRELSTNAIDACIEANTPINFEVHMPTLTEAYFSVRDYGSGLPEKDIIGLFTVVGASTKRNSNSLNGQFGMGRLSPLAYTSSFTVESFYNGQHISYLISTKDGIPTAVKLQEIATTEPNGLQISLDVNPQDIQRFHKEAFKLYKFFDHKPNCNIELPELNVSIEHDDFYLTTELGNGVLMSNVYYPLDSQFIDTPYNGLVLRIPTGSVSITPGRESLTYDDTTINYLSDAIKDAENVIVSRVQTEIQSQPTVYKQLKIYAELKELLPHKERKHLQLPQPPFGKFYENSYWRNDFTIESNFFNVLVKTPSYKNLRDITDVNVSISTFCKASYIIADQRQYTATVKEQDTDYKIVFRPKDFTKSGIELQAPLIEDYLKQLGITDYIKASENQPLITTSGKRTKLTSIPLSKPTSWNFNNTDTFSYDLSDTTDICYVELNRNNPTGYSFSLVTAYKSFSEYLVKQGNKPLPPVYGLSKRYKKRAEKHKHLHEMKEYLTNYLSSNPITFHTPTITDSFNRINWSLKDNLLACNYAPTDLKEAIKERQQVQNINFEHRQMIAELTRHTSITSKTQPFKYNFDDWFTKYPLLHTLQYSNSKDIDHYLKLENHYANSIHKNE